jgi:hypothetical protein
VRSGFRTPASTRRILVLTPTDRETSARDARKNNEILDSQYRIAEQLSRIIDTLQDLSGRHIPSLRLEFDKRDTKNVSLDEFLNHFRHHEEVRIIIPLTTIPPAAATVAPADFGMTHLIGIQTRPGKRGWHNGPSPYDAEVTVERDLAWPVVVDVALDIAMSHSFAFLREMLFGAALSVKKREYCIEKQLSTFYGSLDASARYISLAATSRRSVQFDQTDCKDYYARWLDFLAWALLPTAVSAESILDALHQTQEPSSIASRILRLHRRSGQLSPRELEAAIGQLKPGTYILIVAEHKPSHRPTEKRILALIKKKKWHTNAFTIVPYSQRATFIDLYPFVSMATFEV